MDGLSREQLVVLKSNQSEKGEPVSAQAEATGQAAGWAEQWDSKIPRLEAIEWPKDMGVAPIKLMLRASTPAALTASPPVENRPVGVPAVPDAPQSISPQG